LDPVIQYRADAAEPVQDVSQGNVVERRLSGVLVGLEEQFWRLAAGVDG
jgi:hypothetical protein